MKSSQHRREEAVERMVEAKFKDSKACKKGTKTEEQWQKWRKAEIERITKLPTKRGNTLTY